MVKVRINKQFYKDFNFYFYMLFIFLWIKPLIDAENGYELTYCLVFLVGAIIATLLTIFKNK